MVPGNYWPGRPQKCQYNSFQLIKIQEDGTVMELQEPGLGIELDEDKIEHDWQNPETCNALDGSVVDW